MVLNSYAKLNLYLEVLNIRQDKFHNIKTIFERIDLSDRIILKPRLDTKIKIICKDPGVPGGNTNLCYRAAKLLKEGFSIERGVDIKIIKRIPVGAGLGGGSSNAASTFLGLNKLWKLRLPQDKLARLAKNIGSDIPFFIYNTPFAKGLGRGERIEALRVPKSLRLWHILVVPQLRVSTPFIYGKWDKMAYSGLTPPFLSIKRSEKKERAGLTRPKYDVKIIISELRRNALPLAGGLLFNSLEEITLRLYPAVQRVKERLEDLGLKSILMSGSGPAVFGIVSSRKEAVALSRKLKKQDRSLRVFVTRTH